MHIVQTTEQDPFVAGTSRLEELHTRLVKINDAGIFFCRKGRAWLNIDLEKYEITEHTQVIVPPGRILQITERSEDFMVSYFYFSKILLEEATFRLEPSFFHFLKENPCFTLPVERTRWISGLMNATEALYKEKEHLFRNLIAKNHLQSFLLDVYDKTHRLFTRPQLEGGKRKEELFKRFISLIHRHCITQREVCFYANELCITSRYLSGIVQEVTGTTAKNIIDRHVILEIKVLLQSTGLSIQEISNRLQFPDQSFFGRYFKKHTGISPTHYRQRFASLSGKPRMPDGETSERGRGV